MPALRPLEARECFGATVGEVRDFVVTTADRKNGLPPILVTTSGADHPGTGKMPG